MDGFMYARAIESIREHGFIDPVTVRPFNGHFEIIDGEHRWKAATTLGISSIPCMVLVVGDAAARKLTILLNDLHGQSDQQKLAALLRDLAESESIERLVETLPFTPETFKGIVGLADFTWPESLDPSIPVKPATDDGKKRESFVERTYRLPKAAAEVLDDALFKAKDGDDIADWQALERLAAEFLAG